MVAVESFDCVTDFVNNEFPSFKKLNVCVDYSIGKNVDYSQPFEQGVFYELVKKSEPEQPL